MIQYLHCAPNVVTVCLGWESTMNSPPCWASTYIHAWAGAKEETDRCSQNQLQWTHRRKIA